MKKQKNSKINSILVMIIIITMVTFASGKTIYVDDDATGANDGSSWENAYVYLQDALVNAKTADKPVEIRVAQGTYKPDQGVRQTPGDREATFQLINGVTLAGGYGGIDENDPNTYNFELYETILSGDLNDDDMEVSVKDLWNEPTRAENSYHVLIGSGTDMTAVLDGFIITGGAANGTELDDDPFDNDRLRCGGGMYNWEGSPTLTNCTFSGNLGGLVGGMSNYISSVTLTNCTFSGNMGGQVGGMSNIEGNPILTNCKFSDNWGWTAGGIYNYKGSSTLTNCTFSGNSDGGMTNSGSSVTLTNCTFSGNFRGVNNSLSSVSLANCIFSGNYYSAIRYNSSWDDPNSVSILTNCTFSGNDGGVIRYSINPNSDHSDPGPILTNCILWYNAPNEIPQTSIVTYSNIQGGWEGEGNINEDPLFAEPGYWADVNDPNIVVEPNDPNSVWINGDYHLESEYGRWNPDTQTWATDDVTSPCIDAGDTNMPVGDEPFPNGVIINMGAYGGTTEASKSISDIPDVVNVNENDNGGQVTLKQGQILAVTLESNPSTGYSWAPVEKEGSILEKFGDTLYFPAEQEDEIVGSGRWEIFYFKSINIGQETLELIYRRPWETDVEPAKTFSIEVTVN